MFHRIGSSWTWTERVSERTSYFEITFVASAIFLFSFLFHRLRFILAGIFIGGRFHRLKVIARGLFSTKKSELAAADISPLFKEFL